MIEGPRYIIQAEKHSADDFCKACLWKWDEQDRQYRRFLTLGSGTLDTLRRLACDLKAGFTTEPTVANVKEPLK
jgi:hypothetical protein